MNVIIIKEADNYLCPYFWQGLEYTLSRTIVNFIRRATETMLLDISKLR